MHSFWVDKWPETGSVFRLAKQEEEHLFRILRPRMGERVRLLSGDGLAGTAEISGVRELKLLEVTPEAAPELQLILCCAAPRRQKLDLLLKQAVELGVSAIHLMHCARSVAKPEGADRWQTLMQEACKQSGNPFLPEIFVHPSPGSALAALAGCRLYYGAVVPPEEPMPEIPARGKAVFLAGPEGGFTVEEETLFAAHGAKGISLGPWILRLETAAAAGLAVLRALGR